MMFFTKSKYTYFTNLQLEKEASCKIIKFANKVQKFLIYSDRKGASKHTWKQDCNTAFSFLILNEKVKKFYNDFGVQKVITYFAVGLNKLIFQHDGLLKMNTLLNIYHFKLSTNQKGSMSIAVDVWLEGV